MTEYYLESTPMGHQIVRWDQDIPDHRVIGVVDDTYPVLFLAAQQIVNTLNRNEESYNAMTADERTIITMDQSSELARALEAEGVAHIILVYRPQIERGTTWTPTPTYYDPKSFCLKLYGKEAEQQFVDDDTTDGAVNH